jgi:hypothetical protein
VISLLPPFEVELCCLGRRWMVLRWEVDECRCSGGMNGFVSQLETQGRGRLYMATLEISRDIRK